MIVKIASLYQNIAKKIAAHPEGEHRLLAGMLVPTIALGDGLMHATLFHEEGKDRMHEFGKGALSGAIAGGIIGAGDLLGQKLVNDGKKLLHAEALANIPKRKRWYE